MQHRFLFLVTASLVGFIVLMCFIPSYQTLETYSREQGFALLWSICLPLTIDGAVICSSTSALWLSLNGHSPRRAMIMVWFFSITSIVFNWLHAPQVETGSYFTLPNGFQIWESWFLAPVPPIALLCCFELLIYILKLHIEGTPYANSVALESLNDEEKERLFTSLIQQIPEHLHHELGKSTQKTNGHLSTLDEANRAKQTKKRNRQIDVEQLLQEGLTASEIFDAIHEKHGIKTKRTIDRDVEELQTRAIQPRKKRNASANQEKDSKTPKKKS